MKEWVFDQPHARYITAARTDALEKLLSAFAEYGPVRTALDVGCGVGYFARFLADRGLNVLGVDAREANIAEATLRHPDIEFEQFNVEDPGASSLGPRDLVLCFGLLYHLENPFAAVRNLCTLTRRVLVVESVVSPHRPPVAELTKESDCEDQSLRRIAFVPSEACLVMMLYAAGFPFVYRSAVIPAHPDYLVAPRWRSRRTLLVATKTLVSDPLLIPAEPPASRGVGVPGRAVGPRRVVEFARRPWRSMFRSIRSRAKTAIARYVGRPHRLEEGGWWILRDDACSSVLENGTFERNERRFVQRLLRAGMTVIDVGAHRGLYSLLAARSVGSTGRVVAFEPSPRERRWLQVHMKLNRCNNVEIRPEALLREECTTTFYLVRGRDTGCNSIRRPAVFEPVEELTVSATTLDLYLQKHELESVSFIKLDAEGAELDVLRGGSNCLRRRPRPLLMVEVSDTRTAPWGYRASEIVAYLKGLDFTCFDVSDDGWLRQIDANRESWDQNLVAVPRESVSEHGSLIARDAR